MKIREVVQVSVLLSFVYYGIYTLTVDQVSGIYTFIQKKKVYDTYTLTVDQVHGIYKQDYSLS